MGEMRKSSFPRNALIGGGVCLIVLFVGWLTVRSAAPKLRQPRIPPYVASAEFVRADGSEQVLVLSTASSNALISRLFPGVLEVPPSAKIKPAGPYTWIVTVTKTDGKRIKLGVRDQADGDVWTAGGTDRRVAGDVELLLQAREGIAIPDYLRTGSFSERQRLEILLGAEERRTFDSLVALSKSEERMQRGAALFSLNRMISPRLRREAEWAASGYPNTVRHPLPQAAEHPRAREVREIALQAFHDWNADTSSVPDWPWLEPAMFETLIELSDAEIREELALALQARKEPDSQAEDIMKALEQSYGLPPLVEQLYFCGTCMDALSADKRRQANAEALSRRRERRKQLLAWHEAHNDLPIDQRLEAAVAHWQTIISKRDPFQTVSYSLHLSSEFKPLLRVDAQVVPALRVAQAREADLSRKAVYEMLVATITGQHDTELVSKLRGGQDVEKMLATKIMEISTPHPNP